MTMQNARKKGLLIDLVTYALAFGIAAVPFAFIEEALPATAVFTAVATAVVFIASTVYSDVSVYDPYWSVAPPVMLIANMIKYRLFGPNAWILLGIVGIWSLRLTGNWFLTYKGLGQEDWRYAMYRKKYSPLVFHLISFAGLHFMPTVVVYLGLVNALLAMRVGDFSIRVLFGCVVMLSAVFLEFVSDRAIHRFLAERKGERKTCDVSVWKYSRHPNYLGEMTFWTGMFLYYVVLCPREWYFGLGFLGIVIMFLVVSIPMMEKHNLERRPDYAEYRKKTSMLFLWPNHRE